MSFSSLPEELVDLICSNLNETAKYGDHVIDYGSLLTLCLVSRKTLVSARKALYRRPFLYLYPLRETALVAWNRAMALLRSLQSDHLRCLVRYTDGIVYWLFHICEIRRSASAAIKQLTVNWIIDILKCCTSLRQVDVCYSNREDLLNITDALFARRIDKHDQADHGSNSILIRHLSFSASFDAVHGQRVDFIAIFEILSRSGIRFLNSLDFRNIAITYPTGVDVAQPQFPLPVRKLDFMMDSEYFDNIIPFFPRDPTLLEDFSYSGRINTSGKDLLALPNLLGSNLRTLRLNFVVQLVEVPLATYSSSSFSPFLPVIAFNSFPHLTSLSLSNSHGPSLALLESLADSSPFLSQLLFPLSFWICHSNPNSNDPDKIFPEGRISAVLSKLSHLEQLDFGFLPTLDRYSYGDLRSMLKARRVGLSFDVCDRE